MISPTEQPSNIDDYITKWHTDEMTDKSLIKYLGMTELEYVEFLFDEDSVPLIHLSTHVPCVSTS